MSLARLDMPLARTSVHPRKRSRSVCTTSCEDKHKEFQHKYVHKGIYCGKGAQTPEQKAMAAD